MSNSDFFLFRIWSLIIIKFFKSLQSLSNHLSLTCSSNILDQNSDYNSTYYKDEYCLLPIHSSLLFYYLHFKGECVNTLSFIAKFIFLSFYDLSKSRIFLISCCQLMRSINTGFLTSQNTQIIQNLVIFSKICWCLTNKVIAVVSRLEHL
jgi:hypothetical protein